MYKKRDGFTLAELLIVVAIIAVLTAIAIPVFSGHLEKSRQATDLANIRAAYASANALAISSPDQIGRVTTGPMKHTGDFTKIDNAQIGQFIADSCGTNKIVKGYPITVVFNAKENKLEFEFGWDDGSIGTHISDTDREKINSIDPEDVIKKHVIIEPGENYNTNLPLIVAKGNYGKGTQLMLGHFEQSDYSTNVYQEVFTGEKTAEFGVASEDIVEYDRIVTRKSYIDNNAADLNAPDNIKETEYLSKNYFKWDGKGWLVAEATDDGSDPVWKKVNLWRQ